MMKTTNAVLYMRSASVMQDGKQAGTNTLAIQKKKLKAYCKENNINALKAFSDAPASGKTLEREGWRNLLMFVGENPGDINIVLVTSLDRVSRSIPDLYNTIKNLQGKEIELIPTNITTIPVKSLPKKRNTKK